MQYRVEPREVKARLDSPAVVSVLSMGYPRDLIRQAIERRLTTTGLFVFPLVLLSVAYFIYHCGKLQGKKSVNNYSITLFFYLTPVDYGSVFWMSIVFLVINTTEITVGQNFHSI